MNRDKLSDVFGGYIENQRFSNEVAAILNTAIRSFESSIEGQEFENADGFSNIQEARPISSIRSKSPDDYEASFDMVISIFSEGRVTITSAWYTGTELQLGEREERTLYFTPNEPAASVAGRIWSCMTDFSENSISLQLKAFTLAQIRAASLDADR